MNRFVAVVSVLFLLACAPTAWAAPEETPPPSAQALLKQNEALALELRELLAGVLALRAAELEKMHADVLGQVEAWENDDLEMDGQALTTLLAKAFRVAEARNLPVAELQAVFVRAKRMILRADYASLCGGGEDMEDVLRGMAKTAEETVTGESADHFFVLSDRVEGRMQCEQKHRLEAFKGSYRHFIRALLADTPGEAVAQMNDFIALIQHLNQAEASALAADARQLSDELGKADMILKMMPLAGDVFDAWDLYTQESISGEKMTALDNAFALVGLFYPKAFGMAVGYLGKAADFTVRTGVKSVAFYWKLAMADSATVARMAKATGKNVAALQQQAIKGLKWLKGKFPKLADDAARLAEANPARVPDYAEAARGQVGSETLITGDADRIVAASGRPKEWVDGFSQASQDSGSVIFTRSFNGGGHELYVRNLAEPKPKFIQNKSSRSPLLFGTIPTDHSISKAGDMVTYNQLVDKFRAELTAAGKSSAEAAAEAPGLARAAQAGKVAKAAEDLAQTLDGGFAKPVEMVHPVNGNAIVKGVDGAGNSAVLQQTKAGDLLDEAGNPVPKGKYGDVKPVTVLADPHSGRYYGPDEDVLAIGHSGGSAGTMESDSIAGNYNSRNKAVMTLFNVYIRLKTKLMGFNPYSTSTHGAAQYFDMELEPSGFMAYFPDGTKMLIGSKADLRAVFDMARRDGFKGLEWNPSW